MSPIREAASRGTVALDDTPLALKTPDVKALSKTKKDEVPRLIQLVGKNSELTQTMRGSPLAFERCTKGAAHFQMGKVDTSSMHEILFGTLGRGPLHLAIQIAMKNKSRRSSGTLAVH
eukprot:Skav236674  [mRNA]  locus=scaffold338:413233:413586:- [translate_table: standard]